jgi:pimeloyl-ACP methyl ester carboxylesterase
LATQSNHICFRNSSIHYIRLGNGPEWLFCFHGYGEDGGSFLPLAETLGEQFTLVAIDAPFHGKTDWQEGLLFEPADLVEIINRIKPANQQMRLLGYSMGGRIALQLLQLIPEQISKLVLIAPDGLHKNKWQWIATRTKIGERLFSYTMHNPYWIIGLLDLSAKLGLYNKNLLKFVHYYLDNEDQRLILYRRWTTMRKFRPDKALLKKIIIKNKIPVNILFGKYDRVILTKHGIHFSEHANDYIKVTEIEAGHQLLKERHIPLITTLLK